MRPGGACTACPGFSLSRHRIAHSRPARAMDRAATGDSRPEYSTTAPAGKRDSHSPQRRTEGQSRPGCNPPQATEGQSHATGRKGTSPQSRPQRRTGASNPQPRTDTAGNAHKSPTEPPGAGVLSLYYPPPKRRTGTHRAAHRGQAAGGTETPGTPPPLPRLALPR